MEDVSKSIVPAPSGEPVVHAEDPYEQMPCGYLSISLDGTIQTVNSVLLEWTGYSREEVQGRPLHELIAPDVGAFYDAEGVSLIMQGYVGAIALPLRARQGRPIPVLVNSALDCETAGGTRMVRASIFNASKRWWYEQELLQSRIGAQETARALESKMAEQTRELAHALLQARAEAQVRNRILTTINREIRAPLHGILGRAQLALASEPAQMDRPHIEEIAESGRQVLGIISDGLDYEMLEAGKLRLQEVELDVRTVLEHTVSAMSPFAVRKGLSLGLTLDPYLPHIAVGDPVRIAQILGHYLDNAIKFTSQGEVSTRAVLLRRLPDGFFCLRVEVRDCGVGISHLRQGRLFHVFPQPGVPATGWQGGTGFGLAISRRLAEMMSGAVGVISVPGKGSVFWFEVQLRHGDSGARQPLEDAPHDTDPALRRFRDARAVLAGKHILVAEDNLLNQKLARELLEKVGAVVSIADTGADVLAALEREHVDCVLMDVQMPVMDGYEAARRIRADRRWNGLPVIAMTAHVLPDDRACGDAAGMDDFLAKPVDIETFYRTMCRWVGGGRSGDTKIASADGSGGNGDHPPNGEVLVNFAVLKEVLGNDAEKVRRFALLFLHTAESTLGEIEVALHCKDFHSLRSLAHRLKSSAYAVGATAFGNVCKALEVVSDDVRDAADLVAQLQHLLYRVAECIESGQADAADGS